jgi:hypothetical protein
MEFKELNINLRRFSEKHDLVNHALESCRIAINNCLEENPDEGYPLDETEFRFDKQEFVFNHQYFKTPYIKTQIGLYQIVKGVTSKDDSDKFGYYILDTDEKGNHFDDCLVYENKNNS